MSAPAPPQGSVVLPLAGQQASGSVVVMRYGAADGTVSLIAFPFATLEAGKVPDDLEPLLYNNTLSCRSCVRPHVVEDDCHYTVLLCCPHWPDDTPFFDRNAAVNAILPEPVGWGKRAKAPLGDVIVVRHAPVSADVSDMRSAMWSGPLQDLAVDDGPTIDGVIRQALFQLSELPVRADPWRYFEHYEDIERLRAPDGSPAIPMHWGPVDAEELWN
ncbi:hypothetical protein C8F01DRAFT_1271417 [Mycena amicta]|nr:hypothetical protein C8F01DRAFT_1271417 [Mycena amicta]